MTELELHWLTTVLLLSITQVTTVLVLSITQVTWRFVYTAKTESEEWQRHWISSHHAGHPRTAPRVVYRGYACPFTGMPKLVPCTEAERVSSALGEPPSTADTGLGDMAKRVWSWQRHRGQVRTSRPIYNTICISLTLHGIYVCAGIYRVRPPHQVWCCYPYHIRCGVAVALFDSAAPNWAVGGSSTSASAPLFSNSPGRVRRNCSNCPNQPTVPTNQPTNQSTNQVDP